MKASQPTRRPRVSYKAKMMEERARANHLGDRARAAERELLRIREVLAAHAAKETVPEIEQVLAQTPSLGAIALYPISFEAMKAHLISMARFVDEPVPLVDANYTWRGRPLVCIE